MKTQFETPGRLEQEESGINWSWGNDKGLKQVLVVDDEVKIRQIYQSIFKRMGIRVFNTANTIDACIVLSGEEIDIVILDINLQEPNRGNLYRLIRTFCKKTKVIVASVYPVKEQMERLENADGYFDKSDNINALVRMVCDLI